MLVIPHASGAARQAYADTLASSYIKAVGVEILNRQGDTVDDVSSRFLEGQVTVDAYADVTRAVTLKLLDPERRFGFDVDTYDDGLLTFSRSIAVEYGVAGPLLDGFTFAPQFSGPVTGLQRDGAVVTVTCQGNDVFGLGAARRTKTFSKGTRKTDVIRWILRNMMGQTRMNVPDLPARLPRPLVIHPKQQPLKVARHVAATMNRQLFFDGRGIGVLRKKPGTPAWTFRHGDGGMLLTDLSVGADLTRVINDVKVIGPPPKGKTKAIVARATADRRHSLSPWKLGPPNAPMFFTEETQLDHFRTQREAMKVAESDLKDGLRLIQDVQVNVAPCPILDPLDLVRFTSPEHSVTHRLSTFTFPLGRGAMAIGYKAPFGMTGKPKKKGGRK